MANTISLFTQCVPLLDEVYKLHALTGVLDGAQELVRQGSSANELILPKMTLSGLADYDRNEGYAAGEVTLTTETVRCDYDRGRMFQVDALDDEETAAIAFGHLSAEFIRTKVAPELDAFRLASYAGTEGIGAATGTLSTGTAVIQALRSAHAAMDEGEVPGDGRVLFITSALKGAVDDLDTTASRAALALASQVIVVPQSRFYTAITLGSNGYSRRAAASGISAGSDINFLLVHPSAVLQYQKHVEPKVIRPEQNPDADAWKFGYRTVGVARVLDNKTAGVYCHSKA